MYHFPRHGLCASGTDFKVVSHTAAAAADTAAK